jgi:hypothetical protein
MVLAYKSEKIKPVKAADRWFLLLAVLIGLGVALWTVLPILFADNIVQDDFRQSFFWVWSFWDPELFQQSYLKEIYYSHLFRTPLVYLIYKLGPLLTDNLIFYNKILSIIIGTFSSLFAFLFFKATVKNNYLSLLYTLIMSFVFWSTDHVSNACTRAYLWIALYAYMYFKTLGKSFLASLLTFIMLFTSPFAFLLCLGMEFWTLILGKAKELKRQIYCLLVSIFSVAFLYFVVFKNIKTQGKGEAFSLAELKQLPEFNLGGRHPIFDTAHGSRWFSSPHWGLPLGNLDQGDFGILAASALFVIIYLLLNKNKIIPILKSPGMILFYSSLSLYIAAQISFPLLYLPNRYIVVPWLLLSVLVVFLLLNEFKNFLHVKFPDRESALNIAVFLLMLLALYLMQPMYKPGYISMSESLKAEIEQSPKNALIAGHPNDEAISAIPMICRREVFADRERSTAYSKETLEEIRRRTKVSLGMFYAVSREDVLNLAKENGITHILINPKFYAEAYLKNPWYYKPYLKYLRDLVNKNKSQGFFFEKYFQTDSGNYLLIPIGNLASIPLTTRRS